MKHLIAAFIFLTFAFSIGCARTQSPQGDLQNFSEVNFIPGDVPPEFCKKADAGREPACFATAPDYCSERYHANTPACVLSAPAYCSEPEYKNSAACFASAPQYCEDSFYAHDLACRGTMPNYCNEIDFAKEPACIRLSESKITYFCKRIDAQKTREEDKLCPEDYR